MTSVSRKPEKINPAEDFLLSDVEIERCANGILILRSSEMLTHYTSHLNDYLVKWAKEKPNEIFLAERVENDRWITLTWKEVHDKVLNLAAALLERKLSAGHPVAILSKNSIPYALIQLAAMHVGVPVVPISPGYALATNEFDRLREFFALMTPGLVLIEDAMTYAPALVSLADFDFETVAVSSNGSRHARHIISFNELLEKKNNVAVEKAHRRVNSNTIAKFLLTSGSTGEPKPVVNTQGMLCSNQQAIAQTWKFLIHEPLVAVDWLPWHHTFGGNFVFNLVLAQGGTLYIDDGKPTAQLIQKTIKNLKEISPTVYFNTPRGYEMLLPHLENDVELRIKFFARLKLIKYAGAAFAPDVRKRLENLSVAESGKAIPICAGWGATETAPTVTLARETGHLNGIGLPVPGCELKMVPLETSGRYELRVRGPNVTPGYWRSPDMTGAAFDEEGFYKTDDLGSFADESDPSRGLIFAGRTAENFKLSTGTWVQVEKLRMRAVIALAPLALDVVVAGHNRSEVGFLIFPKETARREAHITSNKTVPEKALAPDKVKDRTKKVLQQLKNESGSSSSTFASRAIFLQEPLSAGAGEITDKGSVNQRAVLERRAALVDELYDDSSPHVIRI